jgi:hypothetical protein
MVMSCLMFGLTPLASPAADPFRLDVVRGDGTAFTLRWPASDPAFVLESTESLGPGLRWQNVPGSPTRSGASFSLLVQAANGPRFFRLRESAALAPTRILETSPGHGESGVAVTRETVFRLAAPLADGTTLGREDLAADVGGRPVLARAELSYDRRTITLFYLENLPGSARVRVTLDAARLLDNTGRALDADADGQPGGRRVLEFDTAGVTGVPNTAVIGTVYASERNPDGSNRPLANVTITVDGAEETLRTTTDATGVFVLNPAPAGRFFVHVDGRTAVGSQWPGGAYCPFVGKAWEAVAGSLTNRAGGNGEIFLPRIASDTLIAVSSTSDTRVTFSPAVLADNPALNGVELEVPANALFSDSGLRGGRVGIAPVPPDRLP